MAYIIAVIPIPDKNCCRMLVEWFCDIEDKHKWMWVLPECVYSGHHIGMNHVVSLNEEGYSRMPVIQWSRVQNGMAYPICPT